MNSPESSATDSLKPIRLWPGVAIVTFQWLLRFALPAVYPDAMMVAVIGGVAAALPLLIWWAFFSRAPRLDRWGGVLLLAGMLYAVFPLIDRSIATGMMGYMFGIFSIPFTCLAFVIWAALSRGLPVARRRISMVAVILLANAAWALLRTDGIRGDAASDFAWRWSKTAEEQLLAREPRPAPVVPPSAPPAPTQTPEAAPPAARPKETPATTPPPVPARAIPVAEWPGFRGGNRDSAIPGVRIATDWTVSKPAELWRKAIGPGWSSFAVQGDLLFTQEQRGEEELVSCYDAKTGQPVWVHTDKTRFWESNGGAGPRGTPTLHAGRVYAFGATGILNALDAATGKPIWTRNAAAEVEAKLPGWGFSSSPLVVGDIVAIATGGRLAAFDLETGAKRWVGPKGGGGYSSPHLMIRDGAAQILLMNSSGVTSFSPSDGAILWKHDWATEARIVQPAMTADGDLLIGGSGMDGLRRLAVTRGPGGWTVEQKWESMGLKPYFNDFVVHDGHAYGFDGAILSCIDLADGKRKWKGGRYGHGQMVLLRDQGVLLVLSEEGEIALVKAGPEQFTELARSPAIEGKTWNHPVVVGDRLFVRNGNEMAAFRLPMAGS